ncbi:24572_t:CDS:2 [Dentiscutata erythropus]|uniref:24572_t:CDS:1 n=1 Tax=Dentiscutata erythropus TaxID=1348616 RepID=A0A9N9FIL0_9GLOM|nr:24572_t:CDS:2 [Dentiscutata erythropus]
MQRFKPAHEIYNRLMWDKDQFGDFSIGYEDRFLGIMETTREEFEEAEIPFHRIRYFKIISKGQIIWDRERRLDLITRNYSNPTSDPIHDTSQITISIDVPIAKQPVFSAKSKKNYLKQKRQKLRQKLSTEAREQLEEDERIEAEHDQQYETRMREVEERIKRFQELQTNV